MTLRSHRYRTVRGLHDGLTTQLMLASKSELDVATSVDAQFHNVTASAESFQFDYNFKDLWIGNTRWRAMAKQYIDPDALDAFVAACGDRLQRKGRGIASMRMKSVQGGHVSGGRVWRRWGGCMLAIGYRALPHPQITLHSRTSYLGYIGAMDLTIARCVAVKVGEAVGLEPEEMKFVWYLEAAQYHGFKSMAYVFAHPTRRAMLEDPEGYPDDQHFGLKLHRKWLATMEREDEQGKRYGDMRFGQNRRVRKRWHTEILGYEHALQFEGGGHMSPSQTRAFQPLPDLWASELNLDHLKRVGETDDNSELVLEPEEDDAA